MKRNFDEYLRERKSRSHEFEVFGKVYSLPPTIPFQTVLTFRQLNARDKSEEVQDTEIEDIFVSLVGEDIFNELKSNREFDIELMTELMQFILEAYGVTSKEKKVTKGKASQ